MVNWFCSSALCFNNYKSKDSNGDKLKYRLPRENSEIQSQYKIIFRTHGFKLELDWNDGHICAAHSGTRERKNVHDLPDIPIPEDQFEKIKQKYIIAKKC